jgi:hypothetical protein
MTTSAIDESSTEPASGTLFRGIGVALAGWAVPGLGHLLLRRWFKAAVYFVCIAGLAYASLLMRGGIFSRTGDDILDRLGFVADLGTGTFYYLARMIETKGSDLSRAAGDYGTRLFATAGVLNILTVLEAFEIGRGRRN